MSDSWPGGCEFETLFKRNFFPAYFRLSPLLKHVRKVVNGFGKYWWKKAKKHMSFTDRPDMTFAVTHSHTMTHFDVSGKEAFRKTLWEKEKFLVQAISPFPTMFYILSNTQIFIFVTFVICKCFQFGLVHNFVVWKCVKIVLNLNTTNNLSEGHLKSGLCVEELV